MKVVAAGKVRRARMHDAQAIHDLIEPFAQQGAMLPRTLGQIYEQLRDFLVFDEGQRILGVVALHFSWEGLAELRSLAVSPPAAGQGIGSRLVLACVDEARAFDIGRIFTLTYRPEFFRQFGFSEVSKEIFPQKIWKDCLHCRYHSDCNEIAMQVEV